MFKFSKKSVRNAVFETVAIAVGVFVVLLESKGRIELLLFFAVSF
jgi:hypothetical protein